jgi:hypothetical protein
MQDSICRHEYKEIICRGWPEGEQSGVSIWGDNIKDFDGVQAVKWLVR